MLYRNERLNGVKKPLVDVITKAATLVPFDTFLVEGVRSRERQAQLYAQGRTAPGKIVTWTLNSKHITGDAVDIAPYDAKAKKILWDDVDKFIELGKVVKRVAYDYNVDVRWGYDWDNDDKLRERGETDGPHFELV